MHVCTKFCISVNVEIFLRIKWHKRKIQRINLMTRSGFIHQMTPYKVIVTSKLKIMCNSCEGTCMRARHHRMKSQQIPPKEEETTLMSRCCIAGLSVWQRGTEQPVVFLTVKRHFWFCFLNIRWFKETEDAGRESVDEVKLLEPILHHVRMFWPFGVFLRKR